MVLQDVCHSWSSHNTHPSDFGQARMKTSLWGNRAVNEMVNGYWDDVAYLDSEKDPTCTVQLERGGMSGRILMLLLLIKILLKTL